MRSLADAVAHNANAQQRHNKVARNLFFIAFSSLFSIVINCRVMILPPTHSFQIGIFLQGINLK